MTPSNSPSRGGTQTQMPINFHNCPEAQKFDANLLPKELPLFLTYTPDFDLIKKTAEKYKKYKNIIVIGHGGSVSGFYGIYHTLIGAVEAEKSKKVDFLSTIDPLKVTELETKYNPLEDEVLVIAISKSGSDITQIEALSQFWDFPILVITEKDTPLYQIAQKKNLDIFLHPEIGGRFTGLTEVALLPAEICGFDIQAIFEGGRYVQKDFKDDNSAWRLASVLFQLENEGFVDVFVPIYSHSLFNFAPLITQLAHETFGKDGKGQTFLVMEGPEWQHHTLQRFLDGRKNVAGIFVTQARNHAGDVHPRYTDDIANIEVSGSSLDMMRALQFSYNMHIEMWGGLSRAQELGIPVAHLNTEVSGDYPVSVGGFLAFWQMFAVYSAILRGVNPFDQPAVEWGKREALKRRVDELKTKMEE